ncbi:hypothetical protein [Candidatus Poriferisocius sp.]|uniref:hypothetical protein n=1 Tax=Candidatus Poriferisocius sp. TaxID=3101276 RepID=UPI003B011597
MADKQMKQLLALMPDIATVVNRFNSPAVQTEVFWVLVMAANVDLNFVDWEHPAMRWNTSESWLLKPWMGLDDLLSEERLSEAYKRLEEAEIRAAEPHFAEKALKGSLDAEGLRELADRAAKGEPVTLRSGTRL